MKIIELKLLSNSIADTERFYRETLGLKAISTAKDEINFCVGSTKLVFTEIQDIKPVYHFAFDVPNNQFEEACNFIKSKTSLLGIEGDTYIADFKNWDAKSFYFLDNNGNIVEIITRYANKSVVTAPFNGNSYLSVSEIGLVTANVPELADQIAAEFDVPIFHRQPRGDTFTVCGDDQGLFILAREGREWYPTHIRSSSFPLRVLFSNKGAVHHIAR